MEQNNQVAVKKRRVSNFTVNVTESQAQARPVP